VNIKQRISKQFGCNAIILNVGFTDLYPLLYVSWVILQRETFGIISANFLADFVFAVPVPNMKAVK